MPPLTRFQSSCGRPTAGYKTPVMVGMGVATTPATMAATSRCWLTHVRHHTIDELRVIVTRAVPGRTGRAVVDRVDTSWPSCVRTDIRSPIVVGALLVSVYQSTDRLSIA